jgi:hypothetical protein
VHLLYALVMRQANKPAAASRADDASYKFEAVSLTLKKGKASAAAAEGTQTPLSDVWEVRIDDCTLLN